MTSYLFSHYAADVHHLNRSLRNGMLRRIVGFSFRIGQSTGKYAIFQARTSGAWIG
jgi:hypothetical protein